MDRPWPDLLARIIETGRFATAKKPISLLVVGFATDQAKNIDVWERTIVLPPKGEVRETAASLTQRWQKEGASLARRLWPPAAKKTSRKHVEIAPMIGAVRPCVEGKVSAMAGELLAGADETWDRAAAEYRPMMAIIAQSLSPGFTSSAVHRREEISRVTPDMWPRTKADARSGRKKGGKK